jgi:hypothetical protein
MLGAGTIMRIKAGQKIELIIDETSRPLEAQRARDAFADVGRDVYAKVDYVTDFQEAVAAKGRTFADAYTEIARAKDSIVNMHHGKASDPILTVRHQIDEQLKELGACTTVSDSIDRLSGLGKSNFDSVFSAVDRAFAKQTDWLREASESAQASHDMMYGGVDRAASMQSEFLGNTGKRVGSAFDDLLGRNPAENIIEEMRRHQVDQADEEMARSRVVTECPMPYFPPRTRVELPNLAQERIDFFEQEEMEHRENLDIVKALEIYVIAGGVRFRVEGSKACTAKTRLMVEIKTIEGGATLSLAHDQIITLFQEEEITGKHPETIH